MAEHWMQKAFANSHGQFRAKAKAAGMSTGSFAAKVVKSPRASTHLKRQASLARLGMAASHHKRSHGGYVVEGEKRKHRLDRKHKR